jgi:hypothetical protein
MTSRDWGAVIQSFYWAAPPVSSGGPAYIGGGYYG